MLFERSTASLHIPHLFLLPPLLLDKLPPLPDPLQDLLPILVHLQLADHDLTRVNAYRD
jgi:hypothetical protein